MEAPVESSTWESCMRAGDFAAAWQISDAVLRERRGQPCWHWPRHEQYVWRGDPLAGKKVLIRCYHGLGDTVQFLRYLPLVREHAADVTIWIQRELIPLARASFPSIEFLPLHDGTPGVNYEVDAEIMELPHIFRSTVDTLPGSVPYLHAQPRPDLRQGSRFQVGVIWEAGDWNPARSVPLNTLARLGKRFPGITWHALQRGAALKDWPSSWGPISGSDRVEDAAAAMKAMDLIVSVDSFTAHLAGALGKPVWTLLPERADWRWMENRETSPWYPTMKLFRQRRAGDWDAVVEDMISRLDAWKSFPGGSRSQDC